MPPALPRLGASLPLPPDLGMCRRVAERAEALGYESIWIADTGAGPDAFVVAATAALATRGFRLVSPPPAPVPIYIGALMPPMLELAGEIADGVILNFMPIEAVPRMLAHVRAGAERAGRDPAALEVVARFQTVVTDEVPAARDAIRQMMGPYFATSVYNRFIAWSGFPEQALAIDAAWRAEGSARDAAAVTDEMVDRLAIIGSAEHCRARLAEFVAAGVTTPMIQPFLFDEAAIWRTFESLAPA